MTAAEKAPRGHEGVEEHISRTLGVLFCTGDVVELRAFKGRAINSGYFDDFAELAKGALALDSRGFAVYATLNPVNSALLARAENRVKPYPQATTSDVDILRRAWLPVDFDPVRPADVSSTDEEKRAAVERACEVRDVLASRGWTNPVEGDSGNGAHLLYPVDVPNDRESLDLIKGALEALAFEFSDATVKVDTSTCNAARIWKLYGTTARKGDDTSDRPHRASRIVEARAPREAVGRGLIEALASTLPYEINERNEKRVVEPGLPSSNSYDEDFDVGAWIADQGVPVRREGPWNMGGYRWVLDECPWNGHADNAAFIVRLAGGAISAGCQHNSCRTGENRWRELREHYEPGCYDGGPVRITVGGKRTTGNATPEPSAWPEIAEEAFHGLPGEIVRAIEPHTEADGVAVLANLLAAFGSAVGRGTFLRVGADLHHLKLNVGLVGETAKGRKGMSWGHVRELMRATEPGWTEYRVLNGLSSGEGLIYAVRDRVEGEDKKGETVLLDEGVGDKRLFVLEAELAGVLKVMAREGNTLSPVIRQAWDDGRLQTLTKNSPMAATDAHVSIVGHITKPELLRHLTETEAANGFANRFVWLMVRRSKQLPFGGEWWKVDTAPLVDRLTSALDFGAAPVEVTWGEGARGVWREVYGPLSEGKPGLFGAVVGRAEAQAMRLAALYAVMDESHEIGRDHLLAALALWDYAEESARYVFGDATGDPVSDQILEALRASEGGMTRTEVSHLFGRNRSAESIGRALASLLRLGLVRKETMAGTGGRSAERWYEA